MYPAVELLSGMLFVFDFIKMPPVQKYNKNIGRSIANAASTIGDNQESYDLLDTLSPYILCDSFGILGGLC